MHQPDSTPSMLFASQAGLALLDDHPGDALRIARMGLSLCHDAPDLLEIAADSAARLGDDANAVLYWRRLADLVPEHAQAWNGLAIALQRRGAVHDAEAAWQQALALLPDDANLHTNLGLLLEERGALAEAERHQRRAAALAPDSAPVLNHLANLLARGGHATEAEALYRAALVHQPDFAATHCNLGVLLTDLERHVDAEAAFRRALALQADFPRCQANLGQLLLAHGRLAEGWPLHEGRLLTHGADDRDACGSAGLPQWQGEALDGKAILVLPEQGYGDDIQFCRYLPWLKSRGAAQVTLACRPALAALMAGLAGADRVIDHSEVPALLEQHDYWTVLLSLPLHAATTLDTIPATVPYLRPDPARMQRLLPVLEAAAGPGELRVGLVWRGNPRHANDADRSLPGLETLAPLWAVDGVRFFSLQVGHSSPFPAAQPIGDLAPFIGDFADTAALLAGIDLLISVDTATAHLAGALGRPCWILLPCFKADWRWLRGRADSPWYPASRLFRQPRRGDWNAPVKALSAALEQLRVEWKT